MSPQHMGTPSTYAATPGSNQPYTCFVCNATATSQKNYIAHLQVSLHALHAVLLSTCTAVGLYPLAGLIWCGVVWCGVVCVIIYIMCNNLCRASSEFQAFILDEMKVFNLTKSEIKVAHSALLLCKQL